MGPLARRCVNDVTIAPDTTSIKCMFNTSAEIRKKKNYFPIFSVRTHALTFMNRIRSLGGNCYQIWIDVFIQNRSIVEDTALRMHMFDGTLHGNVGNFLNISRSSNVYLPYRQCVQLLINWQAKKIISFFCGYKYQSNEYHKSYLIVELNEIARQNSLRFVGSIQIHFIRELCGLFRYNVHLILMIQ